MDSAFDGYQLENDPLRHPRDLLTTRIFDDEIFSLLGIVWVYRRFVTRNDERFFFSIRQAAVVTRVAGVLFFFLFARARHFFVHTGNVCVVCVIEDGLWGF